MEFTKEQKNYLADVYANGKSSSDVFREQHKADFIAGFEKALSLFSVISSDCEHRHIMYINSEIGWLCLDCRKFSDDKQTFR